MIKIKNLLHHYSIQKKKYKSTLPRAATRGQ